MEQEDSRGSSAMLEGRIYILRVWRDGQDGRPHDPPSWRATVREGSDGVRRSFASIDDCIEHLYGELLRR